MFPLKKGKIIDEDIKKKMGSYSLENEVIRAKEIVNDLNKKVRGYVKEENKDIQITEEERKFLEDIFKCFITFSSPVSSTKKYLN